jgi:cytochrome c oxidase subunit 2
VKLLLQSEDVIHSLWIPDFRIKMDLVPGHITRTWFEAPEPGVHDLVCTEYCGTGHSAMLATVVVQPPSEFRQWLEDRAAFAENMSPAERGQLLFRTQGCASCHSVDEERTAKVGPPLWNVFGETHQFTDGGSATVDENYLRESILNPNAKIRQGYRAQMNAYQGVLDNEQVMDLIQYIKSLRPAVAEDDDPAS